MSALLKELAVCGAGLLCAAAAVYGLGDRDTLVPPPESVGEEFVTWLTTGRIAPARSLLEADLAARMDTDSLQAVAATLRRDGDISRVEAAPRSRAGDSATAEVILVTEAGDTLQLELSLVWQKGGWRVHRVSGSALRPPGQPSG